MNNKLKVIDLFCGAGGLSEGFKQAGFQSVLGIDTNEKALETFKLNHRAETLNIDISKLESNDILNKTKVEIDLIIGGPPCQGFSMAGKRDPKDPRNALVKHFLEIVNEIRPKVFLIENVPGLLSMKTSTGKKSIEIIEEMAKEFGYELEIHLLNAEDYGVPQRRKRIFIVGSRIGKLNLDIKKSNKIPVSKILTEKRKVPEVYFYSERRIEGFRRREIKNKKLGRGFGWQFLDLDKPSYTIRARYYKDGSEALVKYSEDDIRMLTPEECSRIQSFPKDYEFYGGKIQKYIQIGNAVPPLLAKAVAKSIKRVLSK
jgi:DNA (cytosine-5)-methyltransferase 1